MPKIKTNICNLHVKYINFAGDWNVEIKEHPEIKILNKSSVDEARTVLFLEMKKVHGERIRINLLPEVIMWI
jgi:hypothetical protein